MVIILPQGGQLQNYLKLDLGELENHLWAHVESKSSKKSFPSAVYHAFIHHFISSYAVLLSFFFFRRIAQQGSLSLIEGISSSGKDAARTP